MAISTDNVNYDSIPQQDPYSFLDVVPPVTLSLQQQGERMQTQFDQVSLVEEPGNLIAVAETLPKPLHDFRAKDMGQQLKVTNFIQMMAGEDLRIDYRSTGINAYDPEAEPYDIGNATARFMGLNNYEMFELGQQGRRLLAKGARDVGLPMLATVAGLERGAKKAGITRDEDGRPQIKEVKTEDTVTGRLYQELSRALKEEMGEGGNLRPANPETLAGKSIVAVTETAAAVGYVGTTLAKWYLMFPVAFGELLSHYHIEQVEEMVAAGEDVKDAEAKATYRTLTFGSLLAAFPAVLREPLSKGIGYARALPWLQNAVDKGGRAMMTAMTTQGGKGAAAATANAVATVTEREAVRGLLAEGAKGTVKAALLGGAESIISDAGVAAYDLAMHGQTEEQIRLDKAGYQAAAFGGMTLLLYGFGARAAARQSRTAYSKAVERFKNESKRAVAEDPSAVGEAGALAAPRTAGEVRPADGRILGAAQKEGLILAQDKVVLEHLAITKTGTKAQLDGLIATVEQTMAANPRMTDLQTRELLALRDLLIKARADRFPISGAKPKNPVNEGNRYRFGDTTHSQAWMKLDPARAPVITAIQDAQLMPVHRNALPVLRPPAGASPAHLAAYHRSLMLQRAAAGQLYLSPGDSLFPEDPFGPEIDPPETSKDYPKPVDPAPEQPPAPEGMLFETRPDDELPPKIGGLIAGKIPGSGFNQKANDPGYIESPEAIEDNVADILSGAEPETITDPKFALDNLLREARLQAFETSGKNEFTFGASSEGMNDTQLALRDREEMQVVVGEWNTVMQFAFDVRRGEVFTEFAPKNVQNVLERMRQGAVRADGYYSPGTMFFPVKLSPVADKVTHPKTYQAFKDNIQSYVDSFAQRSFEKILPALQEVTGTTGTEAFKGDVTVPYDLTLALAQSLNLGRVGKADNVRKILRQMGIETRASRPGDAFDVDGNVVLRERMGDRTATIPFADLRDMLIYRMTPKTRRIDFVDATTKEYIPFADTFASNLLSRRDGSVTLDNVYSMAGLLKNAARRGGDAGRTRMFGNDSTWQLVVEGNKLSAGETFTAMEGAVEVEVVSLTEAKLAELGYSNVKPDANGNVLLVNLEAGDGQPMFVQTPEAFLVDGARDSTGVVPVLKMDRQQLADLFEVVTYVREHLATMYGNKIPISHLDAYTRLGKLKWFDNFAGRGWSKRIYKGDFRPEEAVSITDGKAEVYMERLYTLLERRLAGEASELPTGPLFEGVQERQAALGRLDGTRHRYNGRGEEAWHKRALRALKPFTQSGDLQIGRDTKRVVNRVTGVKRSAEDYRQRKLLSDQLLALERATRAAFREGKTAGRQAAQPIIDQLREGRAKAKTRQQQLNELQAQGRLAILYGGRIDPATGDIVVRPQVLKAIEQGLLKGPEQLEALAQRGEDTDEATLFEQKEGEAARTELEKLAEAQRQRDEGLGVPVSQTGQESGIRAKILATSGLITAKTPESAKTAIIEALRKIEIAEANFALQQLRAEEGMLRKEMTPEVLEKYEEMFGPGGAIGGETGLSFSKKTDQQIENIAQVLQLAQEGIEIPETVLISYRQQLEKAGYQNIDELKLSGKEEYAELLEVDPYNYYNSLREQIRQLRIESSRTTAAREAERANKVDSLANNLVADIEAGVATGQFKGTNVRTGTDLPKTIRGLTGSLARDPKQIYSYFMTRYTNIVQYLTGSRDSALYKFLVREVNAAASYANAVMLSHGQRTNEVRRAIGLVEKQIAQAGKADKGVVERIFNFGTDYKVQISGRAGDDLVASDAARPTIELTFGELAHLALLMKDPDNFDRIFIRGDNFRARRGGESIRLDLETIPEITAALDKFDLDMGLNTEILPDGEFGHLAGKGGIRRLIDEAFAALNYGEFKELRKRFHDVARVNLPNSSEKSNLGVIPNEGEPYVPRRRGVDKKLGVNAEYQNMKQIADDIVGKPEGSPGTLAAVAGRDDVLGARMSGEVEYPIVVENFFTDFARQVQQIATTYALAPHLQIWSEVMANEAVNTTVNGSTANVFWDEVTESLKLNMLELGAIPLHETTGFLGAFNRASMQAIRLTTGFALNPINAPAVTAYQYTSVATGASYYSPAVQNHPMIRPFTGPIANTGVSLTGDSQVAYFLQQSIAWMRNTVESVGVGLQQTYSQLIQNRHFTEGGSPVLLSGQRMFNANTQMAVRGDRTATTMFTEMNLGDVASRAAGGDSEAKGRLANVFVRLGTIQGVDHMAVSTLNLMSEIEVTNDWIRWYAEKQAAPEGVSAKAVNIHGEDVTGLFEATEQHLVEMGIDPASANPFMDPALKNTFIAGIERLPFYAVVNDKTNHVVQMTQPMSNILFTNKLRRFARKFPALAGVEAMFQTASSALAGSTVEERILSRQLDRLPQHEEEKMEVFRRFAEQQLERDAEAFRQEGATDDQVQQYLDDSDVEQLALEMMQRGKDAGSEQASGTGFHGSNNSTKGTARAVAQQISVLTSISTLGALVLYLKGDLKGLEPKDIGISTLRKFLQTNFPVLAGTIEAAYRTILGKPGQPPRSPVRMAVEDIGSAIAAVTDVNNKASDEERQLALVELGMLATYAALPMTRPVSAPGYLTTRSLREAEADKRRKAQRFGTPIEVPSVPPRR